MLFSDNTQDNIKRKQTKSTRQLLQLHVSNMYKLIVYLLAVAAIASAVSTPVRKCKNFNQTLFKQVTVKTPRGVCTKQPCELVSGGNVTTDISFEVFSEVKKITLKCNATALGVTIDYPITNAEKGCDMLTNTFCPIEPDTEADLTFRMTVLKIFPKVAVDLVIYMLDQNQKVISCFEVATKVV